MAEPLPYERGALGVEVGALELMGFLQAPSEPQRRWPYLFDIPEQVTSRVEVRSPRPMRPHSSTNEVRDAHFALDTRFEITGDTFVATRRLERRRRDVAPADLTAFRENVLKARGSSASRLTMPLIDPQALRAEAGDIERRYRGPYGTPPDAVDEILMENEVKRLIHGHALRAVAPDGKVAARALGARAINLNLLGRFDEGLADAQKALAIAPQDTEALDAKGVALVGLSRLGEAREVFNTLLGGSDRHDALNWLGAIDLVEGRYAQAEKAWAEVAADGAGEGRAYAAIGQFFATEHQGRPGRAVVEPHLASADAQRFPGAVLHFLADRLDEEGLVSVARSAKHTERLYLAEAYYYIGRRLAARGRPDEARRWFDRAVETRAVPQREVTFAGIERQRSR
jgi:lipoprotein NlpI